MLGAEDFPGDDSLHVERSSFVERRLWARVGRVGPYGNALRRGVAEPKPAHPCKVTERLEEHLAEVGAGSGTSQRALDRGRVKVLLQRTTGAQRPCSTLPRPSCSSRPMPSRF